jgi:acylphosphatase
MSAMRHVLIHGRVQAVGYRAWTQSMALRRGIEGWVRNRRDGSVEAVFAGAADAVAAMIAVCRRGPPGAEVDTIDEREASEAEFDCRRAGERFSIISTV